jgi:hypothetical protein
MRQKFEASAVTGRAGEFNQISTSRTAWTRRDRDALDPFVSFDLLLLAAALAFRAAHGLRARLSAVPPQVLQRSERVVEISRLPPLAALSRVV